MKIYLPLNLSMSVRIINIKEWYYYHLSHKSHESVPKNIMSIEIITHHSGVLTLPCIQPQVGFRCFEGSKVQKARPDHNPEMSLRYSE
jgi:hypothetical protein